ncbi:hypothetical protein [Spirillospora albida]|uniref:hypothetical protein n=1 Tax=Spirillospora albida TaxID=58123 RepID=UPI0004C181F7|nr:hypothetical protein [Spirillospora albida]
MDDEPLEGDIGPAARPDEPARRASTAAEEMRRHEAEREARRRRTNAVSGRVAALLVAALLAFLAYDSVRTAVEAHSRGDDWIYPPAVIAAVCGCALSALVAWTIKRGG